jgi:polyphosphate glucokinase
MMIVRAAVGSTSFDSKNRKKFGGPSRQGGNVNVLVIDIGGTNIKILASGQPEPRKAPSGPAFDVSQLVPLVRQLADGWEYDAVSIGYPAPVIRGRPIVEPYNLGPGWVGFDFATAFGKPVRLINDAAMQAVGSYEGGRMLFLGLGTGLGSAVIWDNQLEPLELAHVRYKKGRTFEDYLGLRGLKWLGKKKWRLAVADVVERLSNAIEVDYVVLGGGNVKKLKELPPNTRQGSNANAFAGGFRLWEQGDQTLANAHEQSAAHSPK